MRAAVLNQPAPIDTSPLSIAERQPPSINPGDVLIEVEACAVCRTDLQICEGDLAPARLPIVPGHQVIGTVRKAGESTNSVSEGDRVGLAWIGSTCGVCRMCVSGRENLCDEYRSTGWHRDGGFAEFVAADADYVHHVPAGLDAAWAAPLLCGGAIGLRALRVAAVEPGDRVGLFGFGASATCAIQIAVHWGCEVFVCTRSAAEQARARRLGAAWVGGYEDAMPARLDAAVSFAPVGWVAIQALRALDKGGIVAINAIHLDEIPSFDYDDLWWERQLRSVANVTRADVADLLLLASEVPLQTDVEIFGLQDANEALQRLGRGDIAGAAVLSMNDQPGH